MSRRGQAGAVYVEFLIVFPPLFVFFLCIVQLALLYSTHLGVQHAASVSARSAVVVFPDDPVHYHDAPKNALVDVGNCGESPTDSLISFAGTVASAGGDTASVPMDRCKDGPRAGAVRSAAVLAMLPYAPNPSSVFPEFATDWLSGPIGFVFGAGIYNLGAVAVTFPTAPGALSYFETPHTFQMGEPITVRVTYLAHCGIPIARFFLCDKSTSLMVGADLDVLKRDVADAIRAHRRVRSSQPGVKELRKGVPAPVLLFSWMLSGERFRVIRAETTLPLQTAEYAYQSEQQQGTVP